MARFSADAASAAVEAAWQDLEALLAPVPPRSLVAVVSMLGSLCPVTLAHVHAFDEARRLLLADSGATVERPPQLEAFAECVGLVRLNPDMYVAKKTAEKGQSTICIEDRAQLVRLATVERPWLLHDESGRGAARASAQGLSLLRSRFPNLKFVEFDMNGADDVAKYRKWVGAGPRHRMITMGRPGFTERVRAGIASAGVAPQHCILGPELPDISSTAARDASAAGDAKTLLQLLHPAVAEYLLQRDGWPGLPEAEEEEPTSTPAGSCATPPWDRPIPTASSLEGPEGTRRRWRASQ
jgi:nicotinic acid mononucleotide adenylyltransferase